MCKGTDTLLCIGRRTELDSDTPVWSSEVARYFRVLITLQVQLSGVQCCQYSHHGVALSAVGRIMEGGLFWCLRVSYCVPIQYHMVCEQRSPHLWYQTLQWVSNILLYHYCWRGFYIVPLHRNSPVINYIWCHLL